MFFFFDINLTQKSAFFSVLPQHYNPRFTPGKRIVVPIRHATYCVSSRTVNDMKQNCPFPSSGVTHLLFKLFALARREFRKLANEMVTAQAGPREKKLRAAAAGSWNTSCFRWQVRPSGEDRNFSFSLPLRSSKSRDLDSPECSTCEFALSKARTHNGVHCCWRILDRMECNC